MVIDDQREIVTFLASSSAHGGAPVERFETHASIVFLAGRRAWKLKRAVRYDYLDFSTLERRKAMCEAEVRINRRTAPALYRGVVPITREPSGDLALGGSGTAVDWAIEMERFDQEQLFDRLALRGALSLEWMRPLARAIARLHADAERRHDHGGAAGLEWVVDGNALGFAEQGAGLLDAAACERLTATTHAAIDRHRALLDARRASGYVRQCHGDLHLRNIVLLDGQPTLFDGVEFNDQIACTDVLYDLAFLLMDLWRRALPRHANEVWNGYLSDTGERGGISLLPLFLSCRAAVRAKTSVTAATLQSDPRRARELRETSREYLAMAQRLLEPPAPCLVAIGGFSGTGKTTLARALAPLVGAVPGAVVLRSDEVRKRLLGVDPLQRLGRGGYADAVSRQVYATLLDSAMAILRGGNAAVVDAVHAREADREAVENAAVAVHVPFVGLWLDAPEGELTSRAGRRQHDASDADTAVIRQQLAARAGRISWHRVDASRAPEHVLNAALEVLRAEAAAPEAKPRAADQR